MGYGTGRTKAASCNQSCKKSLIGVNGLIIVLILLCELLNLANKLAHANVVA
jgi:hypothetical protein